MRKVVLLSFMMLSLVSFSFAQDGKVIELNVDNFAETVGDYKNIGADGFQYTGKEPAIIDFYATWCPPCRKIEPIMKSLAKEYAGKIKIYKVDVDKAREISTAFGVSSMPTLLFIPADGDINKVIGARSEEEFKEMIDNILLKK